MPKKKKPTHEKFEGTSQHGQFAKITYSMMGSKAWHSLSPSQMGLYILFKAKFRGNNLHNISFPRSEYKEIKTYSNQRTFYRDLDALIEAGFIIVVSSGKTTRTPNIYGLSEMWKKYGTAEFNIHHNERRATRGK